MIANLEPGEFEIYERRECVHHEPTEKLGLGYDDCAHVGTQGV